MTRPVVGIVGHGYVVARHFGDLAVVGTPQSYIRAVSAAGGRPVVLPGAGALALLDLVDALVLTGGDDIGVNPERDAAEFAITHAAAERKMPLLGVCRGLQVLAVAYGGTLTGDLGMSHVKPDGGHRVITRAGSLTEQLVGTATTVTALHHLAVAHPGPSWRATAWTHDGQIEAAEWAGAREWPALGVQWHPELDDPTGPALFGWLVEEALQRDSLPA